MKSRIIVFVAIMISFTMIHIPVHAQKQKKRNIKVVKLMTTAHTENCKAKIEHTFEYEKGIISAELNRETQILTVKYNADKTDVEKIIKVVTDLGHQAQEIPLEKQLNQINKSDTIK